MPTKTLTKEQQKKPDTELIGAGHIPCYVLYVMRFVDLNKFPNYELHIGPNRFQKNGNNYV